MAQVERPNLEELVSDLAEPSSEPLPLADQGTSDQAAGKPSEEPLPLADQGTSDQAAGKPEEEPLPLADQGTSDQAAGNDVSQGTAPADANAESESATSQLIQCTDPESRVSCPDSRNKSPDLVEAPVQVKEEPSTPESDDMDACWQKVRDFWQQNIKIKQEPIDEGRGPLQTGEPTPLEVELACKKIQ